MEDRMETNNFEEQEDEVRDDNWEDIVHEEHGRAECEDSRTIELDVDYNTISPAAEITLHSSRFEALIASVNKYNFAFQCDDKMSGSDEDDDISLTRVLGDAFHIMDRIKVPMHHDFKPSFFRAIQAASPQS